MADSEQNQKKTAAEEKPSKKYCPPEELVFPKPFGHESVGGGRHQKEERAEDLRVDKQQQDRFDELNEKTTAAADASDGAGTSKEVHEEVHDEKAEMRHMK